MKKRKWYELIPHPVVLLFIIMCLATVMSYVLQAGEFSRELVNGRMRVIPGTYKAVPQNAQSLMDMLTAFPKGFKQASSIIWIIFCSGIMFGILEKSKMVENIIGSFVRSLGHERRSFIIVIMTFVFGFLGVAVGYENNIAMVPIAAVLALAIGGDLMLAAGISVGAMTIGFGLSPINPYTVGTGHQIAELPLFSGWALRSALCFFGLSLMAYYNLKYFKKIQADMGSSLTKEVDTSGFQLSKELHEYSIRVRDWLLLAIFIIGMGIMLFGVFNYHWYLDEISAVFLCIAILSGLAAGISSYDFSEDVFKSIATVAPGAFMVGYATSIKVILEQAKISDTIAYNLSEVLLQLPIYGAAIGMSLAQCVMNFMIPSGSGQALATLPIMIPVGEIVGITRQSTILAFQIGDGVTNLVNPTLGGLIAMLSLCRIPFDKWLRFISPVAGIILLVSFIFLIFSLVIGYGPA